MCKRSFHTPKRFSYVGPDLAFGSVTPFPVCLTLVGSASVSCSHLAAFNLHLAQQSFQFVGFRARSLRNESFTNNTCKEHNNSDGLQPSTKSRATNLLAHSVTFRSNSKKLYSEHPCNSLRCTSAASHFDRLRPYTVPAKYVDIPPLRGSEDELWTKEPDGETERFVQEALLDFLGDDARLVFNFLSQVDLRGSEKTC